MPSDSAWRGRGGRRGGRGRAPGRRGGGSGYTQVSSNTASTEAAGGQVDPAQAKRLLWSWLQRTCKAARPAEYVSLEPSRNRNGHKCTAWVWTDEQWAGYEASGAFSTRPEAVAAAYASAVEGLGIPIPADCVLSEEAQAKLRARNVEERKKVQVAEQRAKAIAAAMQELEGEIIKVLFPSEKNGNADGFHTPREHEEEEMPAPLPPRLALPPPVEGKASDERGNKSTHQLKQLVKREPQLLQGPTSFEAQRAAPGGSVHVCACAVVFSDNVAIVGTAWAPKRGTAKAVATSACLARLDTAATLPSRDEAGPHASAVVEIRRLQQLQPFKVWAFEGVQPNDDVRSYCALWGQVPFQGGLRDFWGEGSANERPLAIAEACTEAAEKLTRLLGSTDCVKWLKAMARVNMEVEEASLRSLQGLFDAETDEDAAEYNRKLQVWLTRRRVNQNATVPPDISEGPVPTAPQLYEPEPEGGPDEQAKLARGVPKLPVRELRATLAETMGDSCCVVVSGGTGSGKSTQIPQYIIDDFHPDGPGNTGANGEGDASSDGPGGELLAWSGPPRVIVTEPRRIAAVSLAERVAWERGERLGQSVGYSVRGDSKRPAANTASVEYCTVGILLRRLQKDPQLRDVSHVLVDEVHERDLMTDFLLVLLKELLCVRSDLRVILMSATLDVKTFQNYLWNCPTLEIPTGPRYTVQDVHLEDDFFREAWAGDLPRLLLAREEEARQAAEEAREAEEEEADNEGDEPAYRSSTGTWWGSAENDEMFIDLLARLIMHLAEGPALVDDDGVPGSILCFLPGWAEIKTCQDRLQELDRDWHCLWILPLHSTLPKAEQQLIFQRPPEGKTKVILGTNIAESSVTIDDVLVVLDSGLTREVSYDPIRHLSTLETVWVSQSSAIQRLGRAGRVRKGRCMRLYSRTQLEQSPWRTTPEMQRCELMSTCLQALALKREVRDFLARAPDPPSRAAVETALEELLQLGAITAADEASSGAGGMREQMMPLGDALSRMTLSPKLGRMLILATIFDAADVACLLAAVIAAARRIFVSPPGKKKESLACVRGFSTNSDTLAAYEAVKCYEGWKYARSEGYADRWASELFLVPKRLKQLLAARDMHWEELQRAGLVSAYDWKNGATGGNWRFGSTSWDGSWEGKADASEVWEEAPNRAAAEAVDNVDASTTASTGTGVEEGNTAMGELVKALLVAAYPQSVALRRRTGLAKHQTPTGLEAIIAPQSVNAPPKAKASAPASRSSDERQPSWWSYGQMHISNRQGFLRHTTLIDPYHIALFGGMVATEDSNGALREIDGWIELRGPRMTLRMFAQLRDCMSRCIHLRALEPYTPLPKGVRAVLQDITNLLKAATPRQDRIAACLPENYAQPIERPPPPSQWRQHQSRRVSANNSSGGYGNSYGGRGSAGDSGGADANWERSAGGDRRWNRWEGQGWDSGSKRGWDSRRQPRDSAEGGKGRANNGKARWAPVASNTWNEGSDETGGAAADGTHGWAEAHSHEGSGWDVDAAACHGSAEDFEGASAPMDLHSAGGDAVWGGCAGEHGWGDGSAGAAESAWGWPVQHQENWEVGAMNAGGAGWSGSMDHGAGSQAFWGETWQPTQ